MAENWLKSIYFEEYLGNFLHQGYDLHTISRMTPEDLIAIGITNPQHRKKIRLEINNINVPDGIPHTIPESLYEWLYALRLEQYYASLDQQGFDTVTKVAQLTWEDFEDIGIRKLGHQKKLTLAIKRYNILVSGGASSVPGVTDGHGSAIGSTVSSSPSSGSCSSDSTSSSSSNGSSHYSSSSSGISSFGSSSVQGGSGSFPDLRQSVSFHRPLTIREHNNLSHHINGSPMATEPMVGNGGGSHTLQRPRGLFGMKPKPVAMIAATKARPLSSMDSSPTHSKITSSPVHALYDFVQDMKMKSSNKITSSPLDMLPISVSNGSLHSVTSTGTNGTIDSADGNLFNRTKYSSSSCDVSSIYATLKRNKKPPAPPNRTNSIRVSIPTTPDSGPPTPIYATAHLHRSMSSGSSGKKAPPPPPPMRINSTVTTSTMTMGSTNPYHQQPTIMGTNHHHHHHHPQTAPQQSSPCSSIGSASSLSLTCFNKMIPKSSSSLGMYSEWPDHDGSMYQHHHHPHPVVQGPFNGSGSLCSFSSTHSHTQSNISNHQDHQELELPLPPPPSTPPLPPPPPPQVKEQPVQLSLSTFQPQPKNAPHMGSCDFPPPPSPLTRSMDDVTRGDFFNEEVDPFYSTIGVNEHHGHGHHNMPPPPPPPPLPFVGSSSSCPMKKMVMSPTSDSSICSSSSSDSLPFANETVGTIKMTHNGPNGPNGVSFGANGPTFRMDSFSSLNSSSSTSSSSSSSSSSSPMSPGVPSAASQLLMSMSQSHVLTKPSTPSPSPLIHGIKESPMENVTIIDDIETMLANLSNQLDAMLQQDITPSGASFIPRN